MADCEKNNSTAINEWHMVPIVPLLAISIHKAIYIGGTAEAAETVTGALCYLPVMTKLSFDFRSFAPVCVYVCLAKLHKWLLYVRSVYNMRHSLRVQNKVILILFVY